MARRENQKTEKINFSVIVRMRDHFPGEFKHETLDLIISPG